jgi:hypothetical protein
VPSQGNITRFKKCLTLGAYVKSSWKSNVLLIYYAIPMFLSNMLLIVWGFALFGRAVKWPELAANLLLGIGQLLCICINVIVLHGDTSSKWQIFYSGESLCKCWIWIGGEGCSRRACWAHATKTLIDEHKQDSHFSTGC